MILEVIHFDAMVYYLRVLVVSNTTFPDDFLRVEGNKGLLRFISLHGHVMVLYVKK